MNSREQNFVSAVVYADKNSHTTCPAKPKTALPYMSQLARKYMKPILKASEVDDSWPTVIRQYSNDRAFFSVLSGKINTVYDLDEVLEQ